ncbi:MAG: hypothetical protein IID34_01725 [Planctomycetes bacterium]|nr:hypothetical protein [Planctomycetota bacterium]
MPNETCEELQVDACVINQGGDYQGDKSTCASGLCEQIECAIDSDCDDGNACNGEEMCVANICQNGPPPDGAPCDDGDACITGEICTGGVCGGGSAVLCPDPNTDDCEFPVCDPAGAEGNCLGTDNETDGTGCDDGNACNTGETCTGGVCGGGSAVLCPDPNTDDCEFPVCDPGGAEDNCLGTDNETDGTGCDDGLFCDGTETCTAGMCGNSTGDPCAGGAECNASCNEDADNCFDPDGTNCGDGATQCSGQDTCDGAGGCQDNHEQNGTLCDDQDACTENDQCTTGNCGGTAVDCTGVGDQCNTASCDPAGADGNCDILTQEPDGTPCDDQDACTESDICTSGVCGGAAVDCTGAGDQCNTASCDPAGAEGNCDILTPKPDGTLCDDQDDCTENDQCTAGLCGGAPIMPCCGNGIIEGDEQCDPPDGKTCDENCQPFPTGACCKITGNCEEAISENACNAAGGTYQGNGSICEPDLCPPCIPNPGAAQNDCCADAIPIFTGLTGFNTTNSNTDGPSHFLVCEFDGQTYHDIWYHYTADCTAATIITTCEDLGGSADYDTDLVVYDSCDCDNLILLGCDDDDANNPCGAIPNFHSTITVPMVAGSCYLIRVGGWDDKDQGVGTLLIDPQCGACCQGDTCIDSQDSQECTDAGGAFQGVGSACVVGGGDIDCTITGACCTTGGGCAQMTSQGCAEQSGDYQGDGIACDPDPCGCGDCPTDVNDDGETGPFDLAFLLGNWGPFGPDAQCLDANFDDIIGPFDLAFLLGNWGPCQ